MGGRVIRTDGEQTGHTGDPGVERPHLETTQASIIQDIRVVGIGGENSVIPESRFGKLAGAVKRERVG